MIHLLEIKGRLVGLNDYISANRTHKQLGAKMKKMESERIGWHIKQQLNSVKIENPVNIVFYWYEPNKKRDLDNISSMGRKLIQDSLVECGVLKNDGWNEIHSIKDEFYTDKDNPRVVVKLIEVV